MVSYVHHIIQSVISQTPFLTILKIFPSEKDVENNFCFRTLCIANTVYVSFATLNLNTVLQDKLLICWYLKATEFE